MLCCNSEHTLTMPAHARPLLRLLPLTYAQYSLSRPSCIALADARQQHGAAGPQDDVAQSALGAGALSKFLENNQFTTVRPALC